MRRKPIDVEELRKTFRIRDGNLERIDLRRTDGKWTVVENKSNDGHGYCQVMLNGRMILYHVIIWILSTGEDIPQGMEIDHINGNKLDNRIENLRVVSHRINTQNKKVHRDGNLVGSGFDKRDKRYRPKIQINSKDIYLGCFNTEQEAHKAYKIACKHIRNYVDNESFRELIKKEMEGK